MMLDIMRSLELCVERSCNNVRFTVTQLGKAVSTACALLSLCIFGLQLHSGLSSLMLYKNSGSRGRQS